MEAIILAGGKGTRLRPYTVTLPKPLVPVGEHPILELVIHQLKKAGVSKITLAVNHMADLIMAYCGSGDKFGVKIEYSLEDKPLSTVGPIKLIKDLPDNFLVMNGDVLTDLNYEELYQNHLNSNALLTVATYHREVKIDFGVMQLDKILNTIIGFSEKPTYKFDVSMGVYVFNRKILERVPSNQFYGFDNLVIDLLNRKEKINAYPYSGYWLDIGRPDDFEQAQNDVMKISSTRSLSHE
jgi:NDP-sugar pyrophosphorylase family protein